MVIIAIKTGVFTAIISAFIYVLIKKRIIKLLVSLFLFLSIPILRLYQLYQHDIFNYMDSNMFDDQMIQEKSLFFLYSITYFIVFLFILLCKYLIQKPK